MVHQASCKGEWVGTENKILYTRQLHMTFVNLTIVSEREIEGVVDSQRRATFSLKDISKLWYYQSLVL